MSLYVYFVSQIINATHSPFAQDRYNQFRVAMRFWRELQVDLHTGRFLGLPDHLPEHVNDTLGYLCPACPQPGINFAPDDEGTSPE